VLSDVATAFSTYKSNIDLAMNDAGSSVENFASDLETEMNDISTKSGETASDVANLAGAGEVGFKGLVDAAAEWLDDYNTKIAPYIEANESLAESVTGIVSAYAQIPNALTPVNDALKNTEAQAKATAAAVAQVGGNNGNGSEEYEYTNEEEEATTFGKKGTGTGIYYAHASTKTIKINGEEYG
jgi:hypothetical protein